MLPVCELNSTGAVSATNTFGPNGLVHRKAGTAQTFYTFDPFGNVCQRLDETGTLLSSHVFDAYGSFASTVSTTNDPYSGYGGQWGYYTDWETGLQLCGFRYYDAAAGRWLNRDPLGYGGGINLYGYVGNNPANLADPLGLFMDDTTFGQMLNPSTWAAGLATSGSALLCVLGWCDPCHEKDPGFGVSKACWNVAMQAGLMAATGGLGEAGMAGEAGEAGLAGEAGEAAEGANASEFFHGTDVDSALNLLNGADLDAATAAANKIDGPAGFFLASDADDAAFFAARRSGTVLKYTFSDSAMEQLEAEGMIRQPIPSGPRSPNFNGDELQIPPSAFGRFNQLRRAGDITVTPHRF